MTTSEPSALPKRTSPAGFAFWLGMIVGGGVALYGAVNLIEDQRSSLRSIAIWFVGGALALDLVIVPTAAGLGWVVKRLLPPATWPPVRAALLATAIVMAFALPLVSHQGGKPDNPSLRPRDYGAGLTWTIALLWVVAGIVAATRVQHGRSERT